MPGCEGDACGGTLVKEAFAHGGCGWVGFVGIGAVTHVLNKLQSAKSGCERTRGTPDG